MATHIKEQIKVIAVFGENRKLKPLKFFWKNREYSIKSVTYTWSSRKGNNTIYHFAVTDGSNLYELAYDSEKLIWSVESVECGL